MKKKKTQLENVREWMLSGKSITPLEALDYFGSFRLGAIIHSLRKEGYEIQTDFILNSHGNRFAKYTLIRRPDNAVQLH